MSDKDKKDGKKKEKDKYPCANITIIVNCDKKKKKDDDDDDHDGGFFST